MRWISRLEIEPVIFLLFFFLNLLFVINGAWPPNILTLNPESILRGQKKKKVMWFVVSCYRNSSQQQRVDRKSKSDPWTLIPCCEEDHCLCESLLDVCKVGCDDGDYFARRHLQPPPYPLYTRNNNSHSGGRGSSSGGGAQDTSPPPPRPPPPQPHKLYQREYVRFSPSLRLQIDEADNDHYYNTWSHKENFRPQVILGIITYIFIQIAWHASNLSRLFVLNRKLLPLNKIILLSP